MSEVDEKLVERVNAVLERTATMPSRTSARAAIETMREAGWTDQSERHVPVGEFYEMRDERDREKERADYAESALKERNNTIACQDRRYGDLERELHKQRERAERAEAEVERLNGACTSYAKQSNHDVGTILRLERELRELRNLRTVDEKCEAALVERLHALEQRLGSLNYEGVLSSFQQLMDRVAKLEQPQPPSAPATGYGFYPGSHNECDFWSTNDPVPQPNPDAASSDGTAEKVTALDHAVDNARRQVRNLIERGELRLGKKFELLPGLHVWSGDVDALVKDLLNWRRVQGPTQAVEGSLRHFLGKHGLIQATASDAGEGEQS